MLLRVECYAGYKADERPVRFHIDNRDYMVEAVLDQWHSPDATYFKVRSDDGVYVLRHRFSPQVDNWTLESYRRD
jgi:hypothetical protein